MCSRYKVYRFLFQPKFGYGVGGHLPCPPGREAYTCCLNPVRRAGALELLLEKTPDEDLERIVYYFFAVNTFPRFAGKVCYLFRRGIIFYKVIDKEVMEFVRPYDIFGFLLDTAGFIRRQQFGAYGSIENAFQNFLQIAALAFGYMFDHQPDQRFGQGAVYCVHAHVVAIVSAPAQSHFGEVAGADDHAAGFIGYIHKYLGAFPGLHIFVSVGQVCRIVFNISKMLFASQSYIDRLDRNIQRIAKFFAVAPGEFGGAESGHGVGFDGIGGQIQKLHRSMSRQQRQRAVQPAGNPDDHGFTAGVFKASDKPGDLDIEYIHTFSKGIFF